MIVTVPDLEKWVWLHNMSPELAVILYATYFNRKPIEALSPNVSGTEMKRISIVAFRHTQKDALRWGDITFHRTPAQPRLAMKYRDLTR